MRINSLFMRIHAWLVLVIIVMLGLSPAAGQFAHFITTKSDSLMDGNEAFRFVSFNIPNLHYVEDDYRFTQPNPWRIADEFEIRDALLSIREMGGMVTRMYVPSVRKAIDDTNIIRHVLGPGKFDEEAFRAYDRVLQVANALGVRVIVPLVDNWWWWGGPKEYAAFRGKSKEEFWTDTLLIADFKKTVAFIVNRVNTYTGVRFRDDKAILGWETGNELECPFSWQQQIAAYIKSIDPNHLVLQGTNSKEISDEVLLDPHIDVVSTHHYSSPDESIVKIVAARAACKGKKPYFVGEFGFIPTPDMQRIIDTVISTGVSGIMVWSLRPHNRDGGFYYHYDSYFHNGAYRWPGFASGKSWDETGVLQLFRTKAYQINGRQPEALQPPGPPTMVPIESPYRISWRGSTGAASYNVERKSPGDLFWTVIATNVTDAGVPYRPLFADTTVQIGKEYLYRVRARGSAGYSESSDQAGPVTASSRILVDEMENPSRFFAASGGLKFLTFEDVFKAKEDNSRLTGGEGDFFLYRLPGPIGSVQVDIFCVKPERAGDLRLLTGSSADSLVPVTGRMHPFVPFANEYGIYTPVRYSASSTRADDRFLKVILPGDVQVSRVEIEYGER